MECCGTCAESVPPGGLWIFSSRPIAWRRRVSRAHTVGTLAWFLKGCSGNTRNDLSQLSGPTCAALPRGSLGPALGCTSHIVEMADFCLALGLGLSQVAAAPFSVADHVEGRQLLTLVLATLGSLAVALTLGRLSSLCRL